VLAFVAERALSVDRAATSRDLGATVLASQSGVFALPSLEEGPPEVPPQEEVERLLAEARAEHRRIHVEEGTGR
jgi:hypothetical protein